jgi:hypothetical protein
MLKSFGLAESLANQAAIIQNRTVLALKEVHPDQLSQLRPQIGQCTNWNTLNASGSIQSGGFQLTGKGKQIEYCTGIVSGGKACVVAYDRAEKILYLIWADLIM